MKPTPSILASVVPPAVAIVTLQLGMLTLERGGVRGLLFLIALLFVVAGFLLVVSRPK
jgi:hypothetical protein